VEGYSWDPSSFLTCLLSHANRDQFRDVLIEVFCRPQSFLSVTCIMVLFSLWYVYLLAYFITTSGIFYSKMVMYSDNDVLAGLL
jgi:hypothetical protein